MVMKYGVDVRDAILTTDKKDVWKFVLENWNNYCNRDLHALILELVDNGKNDCILFILSHQKKFDLNEFHTGQTAVNKTLANKNYVLLHELLKYDIDVNSTEAGNSLPLFHAISLGSDYHIVVKLIQYGCNVNLREPCELESTAVACAYARIEPLLLRMLHLAGAEFTSIVRMDLSQMEEVSELQIQAENVVYEACTIPHDLQNLARIAIRSSIGINIPHKIYKLKGKLPHLLIEYLQLPELTDLCFEDVPGDDENCHDTDE